VFASEVAAAINGPSALTQRRLSAVERASRQGLPSLEEEAWRYSPIDELDLSKFQVTVGDAPSTSPVRGGLIAETLGDAAAVVDISNGVIISIETSDPAVRIRPAIEVDEGAAVGSVMTEAVDVFSEMNLAFCAVPIVIDVAANSVVGGPIVVSNRTDANGVAWFPRVVIRAGENSECTVIEHHWSSDVESLVAPVTEISAAQAARVSVLTVQELGPRIWHIGSQRSDIGRDAHVVASLVGIGGGYARMRTDTHMVGSGARGDITAVYFGRGDNQLDFRTFQRHKAPHTDSNLLFKGALADSSRAIYTGLINIDPEASAVTAFQRNRVLKLSEDAWAESVPNLEIENNDVRCSHASAVGPVDEDQLFYLESRGIPTGVAETLVVRGFFSEVLETLPVVAVAEAIAVRLSEILAGDKVNS
jgi:Fe-S cluster assembly protein SufD